MSYLVLGAIALWLILRASGRPILKRREWRFVTGAFAVASLAGAGLFAVREAWPAAAMLLMMGCWLALSTRRPPGGPSAPSAAGGMSLDEARSILGVPASASRDEIKTAYKRLMRTVHPDKGGTAGLAAQLNAARDRLLRG